MMTLPEALALPDAAAMLAAPDDVQAEQAWKAAFTDLLLEATDDPCWVENYLIHGQLTAPYSDIVTVSLRIRGSRRTGNVSESRWMVCVLTATPRQGDGRLYWKRRQYLPRVCDGTNISAELVDEAEAFAESHGIHFDYNLYDGQICK